MNKYSALLIFCLLLLSCQSAAELSVDSAEPTEIIVTALLEAPVTAVAATSEPTAAATEATPVEIADELNDEELTGTDVELEPSDEVMPEALEVNAEPTVAPVGCPNANYADWETSDYVLPYAVGETYKVRLSHCSASYHGQGQPDEFAIDFAMDIGTGVVASRGGLVIAVVESGEDGGFPNNLIGIEHEDGTVMAYMHLTKDGSIVEVGDEVEQGELIGYSGNTGLAGYPHLHLVLLPGNVPYPYESLPMTFRNTAPNPASLESNTEYTAEEY